MALSPDFKLWCELQACIYRKALAKEPFEALCAFDLAKYLRIQVMPPGFVPKLRWNDRQVLQIDDPEGWSAVTVIGGDVPVIINNTRHQYPRQQADVMHELAHIIRGHRPMTLERFPGNGMFIRQFNRQDEAEAAYLGGCLQVPEVGLKQQFEKGVQDVQRIAAYFNASKKMAQYRINVTGVRKRYEMK
ncbi:MAG: ImmA/IrrE family metallo-endopeptidase [Anaerolineae bacterium]|nr:ImmA/IrrE family metallo-endopeptidase [Anaerolineae bacterium]MCO5193012.1 ImmA/IrrE family metallo-endopeptidase [Anaerolineae bacterium]MCO5205614.1 ImmA/IrrE family metallo-endopeptidase [Anaerolineae bacterium]